MVREPEQWNADTKEGTAREEEVATLERGARASFQNARGLQRLQNARVSNNNEARSRNRVLGGPIGDIILRCLAEEHVVRVERVREKLLECGGKKPVVLPAFSLCEMSACLMLSVHSNELGKGKWTPKEKELFNRKVKDGSLEGCLEFKISDVLDKPRLLEFHLKIGKVSKGPFQHDFANRQVYTPKDHWFNFLKEVEEDGSLTLSVSVAATPSLHL